VTQNQPPQTFRYRFHFAKRGDLRFFSHHDLMRCVERLLRRAGLEVAKTHGFNPRPKVIFGMALGLGIVGEREIIDIEFLSPSNVDDLLSRLRAESPQGFDWLDGAPIEGHRAPNPVAAAYEIQLPANRVAAAQQSLAIFSSASQVQFARVRDDRTRLIDVRAAVINAQIDDSGLLAFRLHVAAEGSARPEEFLESLGLRDILDAGGVLHRTRLELPADAVGSDHRSAAAPPPLDTSQTAIAVKELA
jgi:radical SAM-linked protein